MKLSAQEEYGLRCLLELARQKPGHSLTIDEIGQAEGISTPNAAKLLRILRQGGFVESVRGQHGGYTLAQAPEQIVVGEVLALLGGRLYEPTFCNQFAGSEESCLHTPSACSVRALWGQVQEAVDQVLSRTTLQDLLQHSQTVHQGSGELVGIEQLS
ncbi:MAG: Rrf2 family transcriptional regulator [Candidatus Latescibacteria bacterium]|nr:Rrf2 family transcriptional regulator [Candidatus Latescibacterota bacterium]